MLHYRAARPAADENLIQRAALYSELELGSWLVYCLEQGDEVAIKQAQEMVDELKEQLEAGTLRDLRASSFAGIAAGTALIADITTPVQQVVAAEESVQPQQDESEELGIEFLVEETIEVESSSTEAIDLPQDRKDSNPDELF
ncbi:MAG: hypothetical protein EBS38_07885 [Actinobacteria bacterium]|nr:hypothetical protein [Actinomycetota bacterium]